MSRQAIALLKDGARGQGNFPYPVQRLRGQSPLWDWAAVAIWLVQQGRLMAHPELADNAKTIVKWNVALLKTSQRLKRLPGHCWHAVKNAVAECGRGVRSPLISRKQKDRLFPPADSKFRGAGKPA